MPKKKVHINNNDSQNDFYHKKITQSEYRGRYDIGYESKKQFLDTDLKPVKLNDKQELTLKGKIINELKHFFSKLMSEEDMEKIVFGECTKLMFKKLGFKNDKSD